MTNSSCPFCNKSSSDFFLESNEFAVIYNIAPILPGHSLVIPKWHTESLFDLSEQQLAEFMSLGRKTARLLSQVFDTDAFDLAIQEKEAAGQSVAHLHMHVVPRKLGDLVHPGDWYQEIEKKSSGEIDIHSRFRLTKQELAKITARLKQQMESGKGK